MTSRDFCYWLQGFFEITDHDVISEQQIKIIKNHLNLVFHHEIDKQYNDPHKSQLIHDGLKLNPLDNKQILKC